MRHLNIFQRLAIAVIIITIIPNGIIGYVSLNVSTNEISSILADSLDQYLGTIDSNLSEKLKKYEELSFRINTNDYLIKLLRNNSNLYHSLSSNSSQKAEYFENAKEIGTYLYGASKTMKYIKNIEIITEFDEFSEYDPSDYESIWRIGDIQKFRESPVYVNAVKAFGYPIWTDTSSETGIYKRNINKYSASGYVTLSRAIIDTKGGKLLGVVILNISTGVFLGEYSGYDLQKYGNILLLGENGVIVSLNENIYMPLPVNNINKIVSDMDSNMTLKEIDKEDWLIVSYKSKNTGWKIVSFVSGKVLFSNVYKVQRIIFNISIVCIVFALIIAYFVTQSVSKPVKKLKKSMDMIDGKNMDVIYHDTARDEIGLLGTKFNQMILRIRELIRTIYEVELTKKTEELKRKEAELDALQMQINPHFLYNTLDIIRWEIISQNKESAADMVKEFADLIRLGTKSNSKLVDLEEEFNHVKAYIKVMEFKNLESIQVLWEYDEEVNHIQITKLTLQPLVENAIVHGFMKFKGQKIILIKAFKDQEALIVQIIDNGNGIENDKLEEINNMAAFSGTMRKSIGIKNVDMRIKLFFGQEYGLFYQNNQGKGACATVRIPWKKN